MGMQVACLIRVVRVEHIKKMKLEKIYKLKGGISPSDTVEESSRKRKKPVQRNQGISILHIFSEQQGSMCMQLEQVQGRYVRR